MTQERPNGGHEAGPDRAVAASPLLTVGAAIGCLAVIVALVVALSGSGGDTSAPAPSACLKRWNTSTDGLRTGQHNYAIHGYLRVQVGYIHKSGEIGGARGPGRDCVVVFAAGSLDPEPVAAALTYRRGAWLPLSEFVDSDRLGQLQSAALEDSNGELRGTGRIAALGPA
jgi:hypothetical protein